jgi:glucose-6-phosphate 1-epimerase
VSTDLATAEVYLQGAHVTAYQPRGHAPVLFLSEASRFAPGAPIRGGIPIAFPWFGRRADDPDAPLHGPARLVAWTPTAATVDAAGTVSLTFELTRVTDARWPDGSALLYQVEIGREIRLTLEIENRGSGPLAFEEALHTYLAVADVRRITLTGLEGAAYLDESDAFARKREGTAPLALRGETDRIYDDTDTTCVVWDPVNARRLEVVKTGSAATVVWNPGPIRARALPDLGDEEWPAFLCVESGNVGRAGVTIAGGARHRLTVGLRSAPWHGA